MDETASDALAAVQLAHLQHQHIAIFACTAYPSAPALAYSVPRDGRRKMTAYTIDLYNKPLHAHIRALTKHIWVLGYDIPEPAVPPRTCGFLRLIPPWVCQGGIRQKVDGKKAD